MTIASKIQHKPLSLSLSLSLVDGTSIIREEINGDTRPEESAGRALSVPIIRIEFDVAIGGHNSPLNGYNNGPISRN